MLTSIKNPLIKTIRKLHTGKHRKAQNLQLLEGTNLVAAACEVGYPLEVVCYTESWREKHAALFSQIEQLAERTELVSPYVFEAIALTKTPDGVSAIAPRFPSSEINLSEIRLGLILEQIQDPGNMGTMIRTAAATGVDQIWAGEKSVEFDHPKVLRSSVGACFRVGMQVETDLLGLIQDFPGQVIATLPTAEKTYWEVDFLQPTLILLGNEGAGLSPTLRNAAQEQVQIPVERGVESLNASIAASLLLYERKRQESDQLPNNK